MRKVPVPSLQVGDVIACGDDKKVRMRIIGITERPQLDQSDRSIYFMLADHSVINWRKSKDLPKAWLVSR